MSKIVYICHRNLRSSIAIKKRLLEISSRILPDNITPIPPYIIDQNGIIVGIFNFSEAVMIHNCSVCLGHIIGQKEWQNTPQERPDGTYALFRGDDKYIEVLTDAVASRTIWYYMNDEIFIASTSQRAIVLILGDFEFNENVIPWILSSGTIGFDNSWDRRINRVPGDSTLLLDRMSWKLTTNSNEVEYTQIQATDNEHENALRQAIEESIDSLKLNLNQWILPLSGGYDSRCILCFMKDKTGLKTITWGLKKSIHDKKSDTFIAKKLTSYFNLENFFFDLDIRNQSIEKIFNRFFVCGEGRIDHISGYIDGFNIWKSLYEMGIKGIIRGDNGMGWKRVYSDFDVRNTIEIPTCSDFTNLANLLSSGDFKQSFPQDLLPRIGESREAWRDRLHHQFRIPIVLAALNDLKAPYVEIINPLLTKRIIEQVRKLPDHLRTEKMLHKNITLSISPKIPFAKKSSMPPYENFLQSYQVVDFLQDQLSSNYVYSMFPKRLISLVRNKIESFNSIKNPQKYTKKIKSYFPTWVKRRYRSVAKPEKNINVLAFRIFMISQMKKIFDEDIKSLNKRNQL